MSHPPPPVPPHPKLPSRPLQPPSPKMHTPPNPPAPIRVAACHASPIFLDAAATTRKAIHLIHTAAANSANLVVFPETFIPAFPIWSAVRAPTQNHDLFRRMAAQSIYADGPEVAALQSAARATRTYVSIGISERARYSTGTLFNANLIIGPDGRVLVHHRKLAPTFFEKLTWAPGDGAGLTVVQTPWGNVGQLICGENTNPLARYALMAQGEMLHISSWPAVWPTREGDGGAAKKKEKAVKSDEDGDDDAEDEEPAEDEEEEEEPEEEPAEDAEDEEPADDDDEDAAAAKLSKLKLKDTTPKPKTYDNVAANRTRAAAHCFEAKAFGVLVAAHLDDSAINAVSSNSPDSAAVASTLRSSPRGATLFLDSTGAPLTGFTISSTGAKTPTEMLQEAEGVLYADLDLGEGVEGKQYHDVVGGYQRHDVFQLRVNRERLVPVLFRDPVEEERERGPWRGPGQGVGQGQGVGGQGGMGGGMGQGVGRGEGRGDWKTY